MNIVVKKVPLTKRLISQMLHASLEVLQNGDVLGMVVNVVKDNPKAVIIHYKEGYYWHGLHWEKCNTSLYRDRGKYTTQKNFKTEQQCDEYWKAYSIVKEIALNKHLYI